MVAIIESDLATFRPHRRTASRAHGLVHRETRGPASGSGVSGRRFYSPELGRWCSRDPLDEREGGLCLYGFVLNTPINGFDLLGGTFTFAGRAVRRPEQPGDWGMTDYPDPPKIKMKVTLDASCSDNKCSRLSFVDIDMHVRYWYIWWMRWARAHEELHVQDFRRFTYDEAEAYARGKAGCYDSPVAWCLKEAVEDIVPDVYLHLGGWITTDRRDLSREPTDPDYLAMSRRERVLYLSYKAYLQRKLAECAALGGN